VQREQAGLHAQLQGQGSAWGGGGWGAWFAVWQASGVAGPHKCASTREGAWCTVKRPAFMRNCEFGGVRQCPHGMVSKIVSPQQAGRCCSGLLPPLTSKMRSSSSSSSPHSPAKCAHPPRPPSPTHQQNALGRELILLVLLPLALCIQLLLDERLLRRHPVIVPVESNNNTLELLLSASYS